VVVIAVKPDVVPAILKEIKQVAGTKTLIVSIAAGVTLANIERVRSCCPSTLLRKPLCRGDSTPCSRCALPIAFTIPCSCHSGDAQHPCAGSRRRLCYCAWEQCNPS
jgi:hypothetical protein